MKITDRSHHSKKENLHKIYIYTKYFLAALIFKSNELKNGQYIL